MGSESVNARPKRGNRPCPREQQDYAKVLRHPPFADNDPLKG